MNLPASRLLKSVFPACRAAATASTAAAFFTFPDHASYGNADDAKQHCPYDCCIHMPCLLSVCGSCLKLVYTNFE